MVEAEGRRIAETKLIEAQPKADDCDLLIELDGLLDCCCGTAFDPIIPIRTIRLTGLFSLSLANRDFVAHFGDTFCCLLSLAGNDELVVDEIFERMH